MSNKYYVNKAYYANCKKFEVSTEKDEHFSTEIEIEIIEPTYEYQVLYRYPEDGMFNTSMRSFTSRKEFENSCKDLIFHSLILESKRERKQ